MMSTIIRTRPDLPSGIPVERPRDRFIDTLGIGFFLWFTGYIASIILYFSVPAELLGWILFALFTPVIIIITAIRFRKRSLSFRYYGLVSVTWTMLAIVFDFLFIVLLFHPVNYYHPSVFVYYLVTFLVPFIAGIMYRSRS